MSLVSIALFQRDYETPCIRLLGVTLSKAYGGGRGLTSDQLHLEESAWPGLR